MSPRIAIFTKNRSNPGYEAARIGADRAAKRLGAVTTHYVPQQPDNVAEQISLIESAIKERPDAVVFVPVHETAVNNAILGFNAADIPLFNFVTRTTAGQRVCFVGSDDRALAKNIAQLLFAKMSGRGDILILEGTPASATSRERHRGFLEALAANPGITVRLSLRGNYLRDVARRAFIDAADQLRGIDAVLSANDHMALGVLDALAACGGNDVLPLVAGVNAIPEAIAAIETGKMLATANFDPMAMTSIATQGAIRYLHGETIPREIILPVQVVDRSNYAQWERPFAERPVPSWEDVVGQPSVITR